MRHPEHRDGQPVAPPSAADLEALLARWRSTFDPEIGAGIEALGTRFPDVELSLPKQQAEAAKRWTLRVAEGRAEELSSLLAIGADLVDRVAARTSWPIVEALVGLPPDPRIGSFALAYLRGDRTPTYFPTKLRRRMFDAVEKHGDRRAIPVLSALQVDPHFETRLGNLIKKLTKRVDEAAASPRAVAVVDRTDRRGDELLAAIYEAPADDSRRQVYADWLLERADPRGELINLQLQRAAGQQSPKAAAREAALIKKHARAWYAGIWSALVPATVELERGFLARCTLADRISKTKAALVMARPEWATVEVITLGASGQISPMMRALRVVRGLAIDELPALARAGIEQLDELGVVVQLALLPLLEQLDRTPVRELGIDAHAHARFSVFGTLEKVLNTRSGPGLRAFAIGGIPLEYWREEAWDWRLLDASRLERLRVSLERWGTDHLELVRTDGAWRTLTVHVANAAWAGCEDALHDFAGRVDRVQIVSPTPSDVLKRTELWEACSRLGPVLHVAPAHPGR